MRKIENYWHMMMTDTYKGNTIPKWQYQEMRRIFYTGAAVIMRLLHDASDLSEEEYVLYVLDLKTELVNYHKELEMRAKKNDLDK